MSIVAKTFDIVAGIAVIIAMIAVPVALAYTTSHFVVKNW